MQKASHQEFIFEEEGFFKIYKPLRITCYMITLSLLGELSGSNHLKVSPENVACIKVGTLPATCYLYTHVQTVCNNLKIINLYSLPSGAFHFCIVDLRAHDLHTTHALTTDQHGAFRVRNVNFYARDVSTTHTSTTDLCGARSGSLQLQK